MDWFNFFIIVILQLLFFLFVLYKNRKSANTTVQQFLLCLSLGLFFGVAFDLVVGKYFGVFQYNLGFGPPFIILNAIFSYGIMIATILLLRTKRLVELYLWVVMLGVVYEVGNYFFPVWSWLLPGTLLVQEIIVVLIGYIGLSLLMIILLSTILHIRFHNIFKRVSL